MSWLKSRARSGERKQDSEDRVRPASYLQTITIICTIHLHIVLDSYICVELKSFLIMFVASMST